MMSEPSPLYFIDLVPTLDEIKMLAQLRSIQYGILVIEKDGDKIKWSEGKPWIIPKQNGNGNGKRPKTVEEMIIDARNA